MVGPNVYEEYLQQHGEVCVANIPANVGNQSRRSAHRRPNEVVPGFW
jgi:hypothetical protein